MKGGGGASNGVENTWKLFLIVNMNILFAMAITRV